MSVLVFEVSCTVHTRRTTVCGFWLNQLIECTESLSSYFLSCSHGAHALDDQWLPSPGSCVGSVRLCPLATTSTHSTNRNTLCLVTDRSHIQYKFKGTAGYWNIQTHHYRAGQARNELFIEILLTTSREYG